VLVVILLGTAVLASLIFYVINVGDTVSTKVAMQNAADSTAIAGAAWMAKSFNIIAMNNVAESRMIALVPVVDALPLSTHMAYTEIKAWEERLAEQIRNPAFTDQTLRAGLTRLKERMTAQREILEPMDAYFNPGGVLGVPITPQTTWEIRGVAGPPPHGSFWRAAESLDEFNQATAESASELAQINAARFGSEINDADTAFITPIRPVMPAIRRGWSDFESPVKKGLIPDRAVPHRLGVYDRLFKWRHYKYRNVTERSHLVPGNDSHGPTRGGSGHVNVSGRTRGSSARGHATNPNQHWAHRVIGRFLLGYTVYGPYEWMQGRLHLWSHGGWWREHRWQYGALGDTYFHEYQKQIADIKLGYMWGSQAQKQVHFPLWITDFPRSKRLAAGGEARIKRTMFYRVEIRSKYPKYTESGARNPNFMAPGTYVTNFYDPNNPNKRLNPISMWIKGWEDPEEWEIPRLAEWVWEDNYSYEAQWDKAIGLKRERELGPAGEPLTDEHGRAVYKWHPVYMVAQWVFGGIDVGGEVPVTNPTNCSDRSRLPAPILLDTAYGDYDITQPHHDRGVRREIFTYLGVANHNNKATVWSDRFSSGNPFNGVCAVAQAEIYNTTSWDLWTQDWKVKLVPVTGWEDWMTKLSDGVGQAEQFRGELDPDAVQAIYEYLHQFDPDMVDKTMHH